MNNATILVVDDNEAMRQLLKTRLTRAEFTVVEAPDGESAVRVAKEVLPDLILCDLMMPDINGYEVLKRLQLDETTAKIPFLVMTAAYTVLSKQEGLTYGAQDVLQKPTPFEDLLRIIRSHLPAT